MTPIPKSLLISLLTVCLLVPGVVEGHEKSPLAAALITPALNGVFIVIWSEDNDELAVDMLNFRVPSGIGHLYAGDRKGLYICLTAWAIGTASEIAGLMQSPQSTFLIYSGMIVILLAELYDIIHAPIAARRHNEKHAKEKGESSKVKVFPTLAVGKDRILAGIGVCF